MSNHSPKGLHGRTAWRTLAVAAILMLTVFSGSPASAAAKLLVVEGELQGEIFAGSNLFPAQSYSAPIDGMLAVQSIDAKRVRIAGRYAYETVVDIIWSLPFSPRALTFPFRTTYEVEVDLIATKGKLNGQPTYQNPTGRVITETTMHFWGSSYTTNETQVWPTIVIESPAFGWNKTWTTVTPIDESVPGQAEVLIYLEGAAPGH